MSRPFESVDANQFTLQGMLEVTAGSGMIFAALPYRDLLLFTLVFAILTLWSLRLTNWALRLPLMVWLAGCGLVCLGLACLERAFTPVMITAQSASLEQLAFFGSLAAIVGAIVALVGLAVLMLVVALPRRVT